MASSEGGLWLEFHVDPEWAEELHSARLKALPLTTQKASDVHLTVLYLGKGVSDADAKVLWDEGVVPHLKKGSFDFYWKEVRTGTWSPPEVLMIDAGCAEPKHFEALYRALFAKAVELGIKVAGTNAGPDKHNGYHITVDKRHSPPYSEQEIKDVRAHLGFPSNFPIFWQDIRMVRGDSENVLWSHAF